MDSDGEDDFSKIPEMINSAKENGIELLCLVEQNVEKENFLLYCTQFINCLFSYFQGIG